MIGPRENRTGAQRPANGGGKKNVTHRAHETRRRGEVAPFRVKIRGLTHLTSVGLVLCDAEEPRTIPVQFHCTCGNAYYPNGGRP